MQRLDVGTSGRDGDLQVRARLLGAEERLPPAHRRQDLPRAGPGPPGPAGGHRSTRPIGRHPRADYKFAVMADGRHSVTHYETLEAHRFASLLEVHLETGRTHQIRVHMAALKHPCVGDLTYGADPVAGAPARAGATVAARRPARLRAPRHRRVRRVRVVLPRRPRRTRWRSSVTSADRPDPAARHRTPTCPAIAEVYLRARDAAVPRDPAGRPPARRGAGVGRRLGPDRARDVWLAEAGESLLGYAGARAGLAALAVRRPRERRPGDRHARCSTWSRDCGPTASACGSSRPTPPARGFYARHGLVALERTDGSGNEERRPDLKMAWPGARSAGVLPAA